MIHSVFLIFVCTGIRSRNFDKSRTQQNRFSGTKLKEKSKRKRFDVKKIPSLRSGEIRFSVYFSEIEN